VVAGKHADEGAHICRTTHSIRHACAGLGQAGLHYADHPVWPDGCSGPCSASAGNGGVGRTQAFVVSEVNGTWHTAIEVPGTASLNQGWLAQVNSVSCGAAGNCVAGGFYSDISDHWQAFVVSES
jgi:hypothetical protein